MALGCGTTPPPKMDLAFLPGECLSSDALLFTREASDEIVCSLDLTGYEKVWDKVPQYGFTYLPAGIAWNEIKNKQRVQSDYEGLITSFGDVFRMSVSVFPSGDGAIVADKVFMGRESGRNLMDLLATVNLDDGAIWEALGRVQRLPEGNAGYRALAFPSAVRIQLPKEGIDRMGDDEIITFEIRLPVKVVQLLHGMDNSVDNPDALCPIADQVLSGTFSYQKGTGFRANGKPI